MAHGFAVVDAHAHLFTRDMPLNEKPRHRPAYDFTVADYLATLDAHDVSFGVIAAASPWSDYNDYTIACVRDNPRLRGTVILRPDVEKYVLDFMARDNIVGVRLPFIGAPVPPDLASFEWRRTLKRVANLDWHVHLHVEAARLPDLLPQLLAAGPRIVVDHLGRLAPHDCPDGAAFRALVAAVETGRAWIKASGPHRVGEGAGDVLRALVNAVGDDRLVWASDAPFVGEETKITYADTLRWVEQALPDPATRRKVLSTNALELYGF
jgi:predicted TIM-barrel fold metal-dependent hydrolase